jgi:hypothetical protein
MPGDSLGLLLGQGLLFYRPHPCSGRGTDRWEDSHEGPNLLGLRSIGAVKTSSITVPDMIGFVIFEGVLHGSK